jgi:CheY-like chemotaxis protein
VEALKYLETALPQPDVILLDMDMPAMNGQQFLRWQKHQLNPVPVVVYSARDSEIPPDVIALRKPAPLQDVVNCIEKARRSAALE